MNGNGVKILIGVSISVLTAAIIGLWTRVESLPKLEQRVERLEYDMEIAIRASSSVVGIEASLKGMDGRLIELRQDIRDLKK